MVRFFYVSSILKMLSFFLVVEALTGLIYRRPPDENSNFQFSSPLGRVLMLVTKRCTDHVFILFAIKKV